MRHTDLAGVSITSTSLGFQVWLRLGWFMRYEVGGAGEREGGRKIFNDGLSTKGGRQEEREKRAGEREGGER